MNHKELTEVGAKWLKRHKNNIKVPNCSIIATEIKTATTTGEIPDIIGWGSQKSILIEVKVSRADFLKDYDKFFRRFPQLGIGEMRYYLCPKDLIKETEIPLNWGLLYCDENGKIEIIKLAKKQYCNFKQERTMLLSLLRRNKLKRNNL